MSQRLNAHAERVNAFHGKYSVDKAGDQNYSSSHQGVSLTKEKTKMIRKPIQLDDVDVAFGGRAMEILPDYKEIPSEFHGGHEKHNKWASEWFFCGLKETPKARQGVDLDLALRNLWSAMCSLEPKHEHKIAGVAYLASLWLEI